MARPTRIVFFSKRKSRTLYTNYIRRALERVGCRVTFLRMASFRRVLGRRLAHLVMSIYLRLVRPDLVLVFSGDIAYSVLDHIARHTRTAIILDDFFPVDPDSPLTEKFRRVDVFIHTSRGQLADYAAAGVKRPVFIPSGVDPEFHRVVPPAPRLRSDLAFIGKAIYDDRIEFIRSMAEDFDLAVYGAEWPRFGVTPRMDEVDVPDFRRVCSSAHIILGIDKTSDLDLYFSNRTWFVLGCGGFLLTKYIPNLEEMFVNHHHLVWFESIEEAKELAAHYLAHPRERTRIAGAGHRFVHRYYPFDRMAQEILGVTLEGREPIPIEDPRLELGTAEAKGEALDPTA